MERIRIITDTASDIELEVAKEFGIDLLPVTVTCDGVVYQEGYNLSKAEFYELIKSSSEIPVTAQISPTQVYEAFERAEKDGITHVIAVTISSTGSGFYQNCHIAQDLWKTDHPDSELKMEFIDSLTYTYVYGLPILKAAEKIREGVSFQEVVDYLNDYLSRNMAYAAMLNLRFAKKSGRISGAAAFVGEVLGFKPIMEVHSGEVTVKEKVRGDQTALSRMIELIKEDAVDIKEQEVVLVYGEVDDELFKTFYKMVKGLKPKKITAVHLGVSITNNAGPKTIGLVFQGPKRR